MLYVEYVVYLSQVCSLLIL